MSSEADRAHPATPYTAEIAVRWSDMDALGHVNNARFFTFDEDVRLGFFRTVLADDPGLWRDYGFILAHIACDFLAQVRAPNRLQARFGFSRMGSKSLHTRMLMYDGDTLAARTTAVVVCFDYRAQQTLTLPARLRERFAPYLLEDEAAAS